MKPSPAAIVATIGALSVAGALAGCADTAPTPSGYVQSRAIDQDIAATHIVGPTATSPSFTQKDPEPALTPWRNEELLDNRRDQMGQLPSE